MLDDGRQINGADYLAAPVPGKALAIFGDTGPCDGRAWSLLKAST